MAKLQSLVSTHPVIIYLHVYVLAGGARHVEHHLAHLQHPAHVTVRGGEDYPLVLQKVTSELHPKVRNHGEGPY